MRRVMLDIETMSTAPSALVLAVAYQDFDYQQIEGEWYIADQWRQYALEADIDVGTQQWWKDQPAAYQAVCALPPDGFKEVLWRLQEVCSTVDEVWCWGASFDFAVLRHWAKVFGIGTLWPYRAERCARTVCQVAGVTRQGEVAHTPLADCRQQIAAVRMALERIHFAGEVSR